MIPFRLSVRSRTELKGVHPDLVRVVERAIRLTEQDFTVFDGLRTEGEQRQMVRSGASQTMESKHRVQADGYGHAVDLVPWINGQARWEWGPIYKIITAVAIAAQELDVPLRWGGVWDVALATLTPTPDGLERAVRAYVDRRRKMGRRAFIDGPHLELIA